MKLGTAYHVGEAAARRDPGPIQIPGYRLISRLDMPGLGEGRTWLAEGPGGFRAALRMVKLPYGHNLNDPARLDVLRRVRHPNLVATFGSWTVAGVLVLATEVPDGSLWDLHAQAPGGLTRDDLLDHLAEAARGIDCLNGNAPGRLGSDAACVVHGDVTPWSIFLVGGGIKVSDVDPARGDDDLARLAERGRQASRDGVSAPPWSPAYVAPERLAGRASRHVDQYSLAVAYVHLRTGRLPFAADAPRGWPDLTMLPEVERPAVTRALDPDPDRRWPSCRQFLDALRRACEAADEARRADDDPDEFDRAMDQLHAQARPLLGQAASHRPPHAAASAVVDLTAMSFTISAGPGAD